MSVEAVAAMGGGGPRALAVGRTGPDEEEAWKETNRTCRHFNLISTLVLGRPPLSLAWAFKTRVRSLLAKIGGKAASRPKGYPVRSELTSPQCQQVLPSLGEPGRRCS
jgi:hypothetical protein